MNNTCSKELIKEFSLIKQQKVAVESSFMPEPIKNIVITKIVAETSNFSFEFDQTELKTKNKRKKKSKKDIGVNDEPALLDEDNEDKNLSGDSNVTDVESHVLNSQTDALSSNINDPISNPVVINEAQLLFSFDFTSDVHVITDESVTTTYDVTPTDKVKLNQQPKQTLKAKKKQKKKSNELKQKQISSDDAYFEAAINEAQASKAQAQLLTSSSISSIKPKLDNIIGKHKFRFLSHKDPEITQEQRDRLKFGYAKNLVAIGPPRVRDAHWLGHGQNITSSTIIGSSNDDDADKVMVDKDRIVSDGQHELNTSSSPFTFGFDAFTHELRKMKI